MGNGNASLVISNDNSSQLIQINENTNIGDFYQKIILKFPNINSVKLFYYEGYSHNKLYVSILPNKPSKPKITGSIITKFFRAFESKMIINDLEYFLYNYDGNEWRISDHFGIR